MKTIELKTNQQTNIKEIELLLDGFVMCKVCGDWIGIDDLIDTKKQLIKIELIIDEERNLDAWTYKEDNTYNGLLFSVNNAKYLSVSKKTKKLYKHNKLTIIFNNK